VVTAEMRAGDTRLKSPHFAPKHQHLRFAHVRWATFIPSRIKAQFTNYQSVKLPVLKFILGFDQHTTRFNNAFDAFLQSLSKPSR